MTTIRRALWAPIGIAGIIWLAITELLERHRPPRTLAALVLVAGLAAAGCGLEDTSDGVESDAGQQVSLERAAAFDVCTKFVRERLKAPGSAEWRDPYGDQVRYNGDDEGPITVTASVDSENGFGALLRSDYECTVTLAGGDMDDDQSTWHLEDLQLEES